MITAKGWPTTLKVQPPTGIFLSFLKILFKKKILQVALSQEQIQAIQHELQNQPHQQQMGGGDPQQRVLYVQNVQGQKQ